MKHYTQPESSTSIKLASYEGKKKATGFVSLMQHIKQTFWLRIKVFIRSWTNMHGSCLGECIK
jgi:hypothetical protein